MGAGAFRQPHRRIPDEPGRAPSDRERGRQGRVINISSVGGQMGGVLVGVHYGASKAGVIGLTKSLSRLLAPSGATANCIAPGTTATA